MGFGEWRALVETYLRPHRRLVAVLAVMLLTSIGLQIATPQIVRLFVDRATADTGDIGFLAVLYVVAVLAQQGFRVVAAWLSEILGWLTTNELRADL
jgi:ATP-binding cassette subfamily B protein